MEHDPGEKHAWFIIAGALLVCVACASKCCNVVISKWKWKQLAPPGVDIFIISKLGQSLEELIFLLILWKVMTALIQR